MERERSAELGRFLRSRRNRVRPCDVGLARGTRRRVPGLRREEVAVLAHIGTSWYTWLEQGRDVNPSESVLESVAEALLLDREERAHLFLLGGYPDRVANPGDSAVGEQMRTLLEELSPLPAIITDPRNMVLAYNPVQRYLASDLDEIPVAERNCAIQSFENPEWARVYHPDTEHRAHLVAKMRASYAETIDDPEWSPLLSRLRRHEEFCRLWDSGTVGRSAGHVKRVENPYVGTLELTMTTMIAQENQRLTLSVHQPATTETRTRLETLHGWITDGSIEGRRAEFAAGPGRHLRAVTG